MMRAFLFSFVLVLLVVSACGTNTGDENIETNALHLSVGSSPQSLDPHLATGTPAVAILHALNESLLQFDLDTLELRPAGAEHWQVSDDGLTYTFYLNPKSRWSNGDTVKAQDYVYAWQRAFMPKVAWPYALDFTSIRGSAALLSGESTDLDSLGVKALDEFTLQFELDRPYPVFLNQLTTARTAPLHQASLEAHGDIDDTTSAWTSAGHYVSNGPFVLKSWQLNKTIELEKNPHYRDADQVKLERLFFHPFDSEAAAERAFRAGQIQLTFSGRIPVDKIASYQKQHPEQLYIVPGYASYYYDFNTTLPPLDDIRVRKALTHVIDREALVKFITKAGEKPASTLNPQVISEYVKHLKPLTYDVDRGKKLLAEAGYPNGQNFPTLTLTYNTTDIHRKLALAIQQMWKTQLGIHVELANQEWKVFLNNRRQLNFDIARDGTVSDIADPQDFLSAFVSGHGNNHTGWSLPSYDNLIAQASSTIDTNERYKLLAQAEQLLLDQAPILPLFYYSYTYLKAENVKNVSFNAISLLNYKDIYIDDDAN